MNLVENRVKCDSTTMAATLNYIEELASEMGVNALNWDIQDIFKGEGLGGLTHSRTHINKAFFAKAREVEEAKVTAKVDLPSNVIKQLQETTKSLRVSQRRFIESHIGQVNCKIDSYNSAIRSELEKIKNCYEQLKNVDMSFMDKVAQILSGEFFEFLEAIPNGADSMIRFKTRPCSLIYQRSDREIRLPMGQYLVCWILRDNHTMILRYENNMTCEGYYSPFVSGSSGAICFGGSAPAVQKFQAEGNVLEIFKIIQTLLTRYHADASPYVAIERFETDGMIDGLPWKEWVAEDLKQASVMAGPLGGRAESNRPMANNSEARAIADDNTTEDLAMDEGDENEGF
jgi:hypothetical protein